MFFDKSCALTSNKADDARAILTRHGIRKEEQITRFFSLKRAGGQNIPELFIDGQQIGYPGYYLKKLDTLSEEGAAYAACLDNITASFHYDRFDGITDSAEHGISSPNGGFYVLYHQDGDTPKLEDSIIAHAWAWRGDDGSLCLNTIAVFPRVDVNLIKDMFRYLGHMLCTQYDVPYVHTGHVDAEGYCPAFYNVPAAVIHPLDHRQHAYSEDEQYVLAHKEMPFLLIGAVQSNELKSMIASEMGPYLDDLFCQTENLKDNKRLQRIVALMIHVGRDNNKNPFFQLLLAAAGERIEEFHALVDANRKYINELNNLNYRYIQRDPYIDFSAIQHGAYINAVNEVGRSALHVIIYTIVNNLNTVNNPIDTIRHVIDQGIDLDIQENSLDYTALMLTLDNVLYGLDIEIGRDIAMLLIERGANLEIKHKSGVTPLIAATKNNDLEMVKTLAEKGAKIENHDAEKKTALFWAAELGYIQIFDYLLTQGAILNLTCDIQRNTPLLACVQSSRCHNVGILSKGLEQEGVDMQHKNAKGNTVLHEAAHNADYLEFLSPYYSDIAWYDAISEPNQDGDTVLHCAVDDSQSLTFILQRYREDHQILQVVTASNKVGDTPLHKSADKPWSLPAMLTPLSPNSRAVAVNASNQKGETVLYLALKNPAALKVIVNLLTPDQLFVALTMRNARGQTVLQYAALYPESLELIWDCLTDDQRGEAYRILIPYLCSTPNAPKLLRTVLEKLPQDQRIDAVKMKDSQGKTILDHAVYRIQSLKDILILLPEEHRLEFLRMTVGGKSVTKHLIANQPFPAIEHSFVGQYLKIYSHLVNPGKKQSYQFFDKSELPLFRYLIDAAISFDDVKSLVPEDWQERPDFNEHIKSALSNRLSFKSEKDDKNIEFETVAPGI
ncbi:ankyrin repeat domain-containing protein [Legionella bononiensis]|uniref:Ankyrin repeat domain-containing protein n=1 Tax=Legionella bononiensis TaxID=2793102 RepID=A0ABS1WD72_9GAMM|nr:ankyrin repeat domain-containing protein [Legionella bononiensis]MBL7481212.1 ankyrin repeat domain-containing protein [Legionella bononiensis]MBL7527318.1 ankyrin repeat domain-containing protein [Legionella bononiensis]MBL7562287.1 ankyrin repeat domain-containing protein [Legionella bononiensis]